MNNKNIALLWCASTFSSNRKSRTDYYGIPGFIINLAQLIDLQLFDKIVLVCSEGEDIPSALLNYKNVFIRQLSISKSSNFDVYLQNNLEKILKEEAEPNDLVSFQCENNIALNPKLYKYMTELALRPSFDLLEMSNKDDLFKHQDFEHPKIILDKTKPRLNEANDNMVFNFKAENQKNFQQFLNNRYQNSDEMSLLYKPKSVDPSRLGDLIFQNANIRKILNEWYPLEFSFMFAQNETRLAMYNTFNKKNIRQIEILVEKIKLSISSGGKVLFFGNGGSAADSQHLAAEFVSKLNMDRNPLPALALTTDTSALTAIGNDYGFEKLFERQVQALANSQDVVIGISTSGTSENVLNGLRIAHQKGCVTALLTGENFSNNSELEVIIQVASKKTATIQEIHIQLGHMICALSEVEYV